MAISDSGFPDLWCLRRGVIEFVETKQPGEELSKIQKHRKKQLEADGFKVHVADCVEDVHCMK